jgi:uncharacterized protein
MTEQVLLLSLLLALVAFLYASVGHGGGSGFIAVLSLFGTASVVMRPSVLVLNILVSIVSFTQFYRAGHFRWSLFWPFAVASLPMAFLGGNLKLSDHFYQTLLGLSLLFPIARLLGWGQQTQVSIRPIPLGWALAVGGVIGLLSGMLGIGGGIFLTPVLILMAWAPTKEAAAVSALFIGVNSISGLIAQAPSGLSISSDLMHWIAFSFVGGLLGAYWGSHRLSSPALRYLLAGVLIIASAKLLFL